MYCIAVTPSELVPADETWITVNEDETQRVAARLADRAQAGDVFLLEGPLGAGKTTFAKGFVAALGYQGAVRSPTFSLMQEYPTAPPILHADLYRLTNTDGLGWEDYALTHVWLVEWASRFPETFRGVPVTEVTLSFGPSEGERVIVVRRR